MHITTRLLSVFTLALLAAACGMATDPMPAPNGGGSGVIQGAMVGTGSQNMQVAAPSMSAATTTSANGAFLLTAVPKGAATLQFSGGGHNAVIAITPMVSGEFRRITVSISGNNATEENEQTETEFEGRVDAINGAVLTVAGRMVAVTDATMIRKGGAAATFGDLVLGTRV